MFPLTPQKIVPKKIIKSTLEDDLEAEDTLKTATNGDGAIMAVPLPEDDDVEAVPVLDSLSSSLHVEDSTTTLCIGREL